MHPYCQAFYIQSGCTCLGPHSGKRPPAEHLHGAGARVGIGRRKDVEVRVAAHLGERTPSQNLFLAPDIKIYFAVLQGPRLQKVFLPSTPEVS